MSHDKQETAEVLADPDRREFFKLAAGALSSATLLPALATTAGGTVKKNASGIKLCAQSTDKPSDEELLFLKQMGAEYVSVASTPDLRTADGFKQIKRDMRMWESR